jgi:hypothetical protein
MLPAVVKYVFRSEGVPIKVRAVASPPTKITEPSLPVIIPSLTLKVTVKVELSGSEKGLPE